jgi:hypothetical protein
LLCLKNCHPSLSPPSLSLSLTHSLWSRNAWSQKETLNTKERLQTPQSLLPSPKLRMNTIRASKNR